MPDEPRFLIRFSGDLSTKRGRAFTRFRGRLAANIRDALETEGLDYRLTLGRNRFFLDAPEEAEGRVLPFMKDHAERFDGASVLPMALGAAESRPVLAQLEHGVSYRSDAVIREGFANR